MIAAVKLKMQSLPSLLSLLPSPLSNLEIYHLYSTRLPLHIDCTQLGNVGNAPQQRAADQSGRNGSKNRVELKLDIYRSMYYVGISSSSECDNIV